MDEGTQLHSGGPREGRHSAVGRAVRWVLALLVGLLGLGALSQTGDGFGGAANFLFAVVLLWLAVAKIRPRPSQRKPLSKAARTGRIVLGIALFAVGALMFGDAALGSAPGAAKLNDVFGGLAFIFLGAVTWPRSAEAEDFPSPW